MAIKSRLLSKLKFIYMTTTMAATAHPQKLRPVLHNLEEARELCQQGLTESNYAKYGEVYDGLIMAIKDILSGDAGKDAEEIVGLCKDLLEHIIAETSKEKNFKKVVVFLPYKASMWDSLESVWRAADADPGCEAIVVPIPYFERNPDQSLGQRHYEGDRLPPYVPIVDNETFDLAQEMPDIVYTYYPYDDGNMATSIDPRYYSFELRKYASVVMYVPYYATSGGMLEGQGWCKAYENYDCIVIQAEFLRRFFAPVIPDWKIKALGSPKFDKVINCCQSPPPVPEAWSDRMHGRKVYFYNTSLSGLLENTPRFLKKMRYVFDTFKRHPEVCLLWRPHPLVEDTMRSMRPWLYQEFLELKAQYIEEGWGIYDDTPDIEQTIALCDVYIGDAGTSVTSLFGVAGKQEFLLKNWLNEPPRAGDWRGEIFNFANLSCEDWLVTENGNFYHAENHDHHYRYFGHFSRWHSTYYHSQVLEIGGKAYACPANGLDILELKEGGTARQIPLNPFEGQPGAFAAAWSAADRYLFLVPFRYPAIVRYDTQTDETVYLDKVRSAGQEMDIREFFTANQNGVWHVGGSNVWQGKLIMTTPLGNTVMLLDAETLAMSFVNLPLAGGCSAVSVHDDELWFLPWYGGHVVCWEPDSGKVSEYDGLPEGFQAVDANYGAATGQTPFSSAAFPDPRHAILAPNRGNMFVSIDRESGKMSKWEAPFDCSLYDMEGYLFVGYVGLFWQPTGYGKCRFFYAKERRLYALDFGQETADEIPLTLEEEDLARQPSGYAELSEWLRYGCEENAFNSLESLLSGNIQGGLHDREKQIAAYSEIAANIDGTAGEKIHRYAMQLLLARRMKK